MTEIFMAIFKNPGVNEIDKVKIDVPRGIKVKDVIYLTNIKKYRRITGYWLVSFTMDENLDPGYCQEMFSELESKLGVKVIRGYRNDKIAEFLKRKFME